jgi:pimeloyl-ACP methyl ester carboxylesterase
MDVRVHGIVFEVTVAGPESSSAPVLLLHGFPQNSVMWDRVTPYLHANGLTTITMDQRGYSPGARPTEVEAYATGHCVDDALAVLDFLGLERAHLVAHDWGAVVGWHLAAEHPEAVATLTAVSVPHPQALSFAIATDEDQRRRSAYIKLFREAGKAERVLLENDAARLRAIFDGCPPDRIDAYVEPMLDPDALTAALNWYRATDAHTTQCPPVGVPTSFIWGERDVAIGATAARACAKHVTGPYEFVSADASHWVPDEMPERVSDVVLERVLGQ